jgi:2-polyprenyl-3-methyl-5-hydroxy-6-metoxy-1,4-benzoquinol methylase
MLSERFIYKKPHIKSILPLDSSQKKIVDKLNTRLFKKKVKLHFTVCICGEKKNYKISSVDRYGLNLNTVLCQNCGTLRFDPYFNRDEIQIFYQKYYQDLYGRIKNIDEYFKNQKKYGEFFNNFLKLNKINFNSIFEVGCGAGGALDFFFNLKKKVGGNEHSKQLLYYINQNKNLKNKVYQAQTFKNLDFDIILLNHVFEHLTNPLAFLQKIKKKIAISSKLLIACPDYTRIDKFFYPGGNLMFYLHVAHSYNFTKEGIKILSRRAGFSLHLFHYNLNKAEIIFLLKPKKTNKIIIKKNKFHKGNNYFYFLKKTEKNFNFFLNEGQYKNLDEVFFNFIKKGLLKSKLFLLDLKLYIKKYIR